MEASIYGQTQVVEVLLEYKADVNLQDNVSWPLLGDMVDGNGCGLKQSHNATLADEVVEGTVLCVHRN